MSNFAIYCSAVLLSVTLSPASSAGQSSQKTNNVKDSPAKYLVGTQTIPVPSEGSIHLLWPLQCDGDGNLYLHSDQWGVSGIRKLNKRGERLAVFQPKFDPEFTIGDATRFSVANDGKLYQLVLLRKGDIARYVVVYNPDGTNQQKIKLDPGFPWHPTAVAAFPTGNLLVTGQVYDRDPHRPMLPFTGLFSPDGKLLKEIKLEDDDALFKTLQAGDSRVEGDFDPTNNLAVNFSQMATAKNGYIYLMRWSNPAILYAITPEGTVAHRFTVDPGDESYRPHGMHIAGDRIAVMFVQPQSLEKNMRIVDLEGHAITSYGENPKSNGQPGNELGSAFVCYSANPESFTFFAADNDNRLELLIAEPR